MDGKKQKQTTIKEIAKYTTIGLEIAIAVAIGAIAGFYLDRLFSTSPWLTVVFMLFGFIAGIKSLFRLAREAVKNNHNQNRTP